MSVMGPYHFNCSVWSCHFRLV